MRMQFVPCNTYTAAKTACPWASYIAKCAGGFMAFESHNDFRTWRNQL